MKSYFLILMTCLIYNSCDNPKQNVADFNEDRDNLINNYKANTNLLNEIFLKYQFKHIAKIKFLSEHNISLDCKLSDTANKWLTIIDKDIFSNEVKQVFEIELNMKPDTLEVLRKKMQNANCKVFDILDEFNVNTGKSYKHLELKYANKVRSDLSFYYRIYDANYDTSEVRKNGQFLAKQNMGGVLSSNAIWLYR